MIMDGKKRRKRHTQMWQTVSQHSIYDWKNSFLQQLRLSGENRMKKRSKEYIRHLEVQELVRAYRRTKHRLLVFDYEGVLVPHATEPSLLELPPLVALSLAILANDKRNTIVINSSRSRTVIAGWMKELEELESTTSAKSNSETLGNKDAGDLDEINTSNIVPPGSSQVSSSKEVESNEIEVDTFMRDISSLPSEKNSILQTSSAVKNITLVAENGCFVRWSPTLLAKRIQWMRSKETPPYRIKETLEPAELSEIEPTAKGGVDSTPDRYEMKYGEWETFVNPYYLRKEWESELISIFEYYVERTPGSTYEVKEGSVTFYYQDTDYIFGAIQATSLLASIRDASSHTDHHTKLLIDRVAKIVEVRSSRVGKAKVQATLVSMLQMNDKGSKDYKTDSIDENVQSTGDAEDEEVDFVFCLATGGNGDDEEMYRSFQVGNSITSNASHNESRSLDEHNKSTDGGEYFKMQGLIIEEEYQEMQLHKDSRTSSSSTPAIASVRAQSKSESNDGKDTLSINAEIFCKYSYSIFVT